MTTADRPLAVLGIETSGRSGGVALLLGAVLVAEESLAAGLYHGRNLVPALRCLLDSAGVEPARLDLIAVTRGPGSHTGLRIGLMAAMTIAQTLARPAVGIDTLEALCFQAPAGAPAIVAALAARQDRLFAGIRAGTRWIAEPALRTAAEVAALTPAGAVLTGSGAAALEPMLEHRPDVTLTPPADREVRAASVARLGARHSERAGPPAELHALYFPR
ncbi:MAG: tRNA (adenosine(37)-N6)-threonylcarbamoyltransferase complex dimerization subunit type 1 TsaB [Planctomycetes bacterium]|nr:tRNA (adenosine(37)-N6)-threonylcarbamoyltransferase complex dimerization subunit type 1 TsaB [Planctomycetota bacterium]